MLENIIMQEAAADAAPSTQNVITPAEQAEDEQQLVSEIRELWTAHQDGQATVKRTKAEIKQVREQLSERLSRMKQLLAKPGRNGVWSAFLRSEKIAKATADRLVRQRQESGGEQSNVITEEVSQPGPVNVGRLLSSLLPRLRSGLTTPESAYEFAVRFVGVFGLDCDSQDDGILILNPTAKEQSEAADQLPTSDVAQTADVEAGNEATL